MIAPREQSCGADYGGGGRSEWLDIDWQQHARWLRIEDRWLHIVDVGEGPVLLLVHGLSGCWKNWLENIPHFARDHRVIAIDLPGFGESEMPAKTICISGYADTIDTLMSELGIDSARIVGNSMGGFIAAELAIRYPARVERLVLVDAAGLSIEFLRTTRKGGVRHHLETVALYKIGLLASRSALVARRRRLRNALLLLFVAHPSRLAPELAIEQVCSSGKPGSPPRSKRSAATRSVSVWPTSRVPRSSYGATRTASCRSKTQRSSSSSSPTRGRSSTPTRATSRCSNAPAVSTRMSAASSNRRTSAAACGVRVAGQSDRQLSSSASPSTTGGCSIKPGIDTGRAGRADRDVLLVVTQPAADLVPELSRPLSETS